ncbi:MAG: hypothetical protein AAF605_00840 [Myxococcota bacterium]
MKVIQGVVGTTLGLLVAISTGNAADWKYSIVGGKVVYKRSASGASATAEGSGIQDTPSVDAEARSREEAEPPAGNPSEQEEPPLDAFPVVQPIRTAKVFYSIESANFSTGEQVSICAGDTNIDVYDVSEVLEDSNGFVLGGENSGLVTCEFSLAGEELSANLGSFVIIQDTVAIPLPEPFNETRQLTKAFNTTLIVSEPDVDVVISGVNRAEFTSVSYSDDNERFEYLRGSAIESGSLFAFETYLID